MFSQIAFLLIHYKSTSIPLENSLKHWNIGRLMLSFDEVDSTNDLAIRWIAKSKPIDGTVITAAFQRQGKGQIGRKWSGSPGKNLAYTVILFPEQLEVTRTFYAQMAFSTAVLQAVREFTGITDLKLKWPNDLYFQDKKLGGILIHTALSGQKVHHIVFGAGINLNEESFSPELENPVSLYQITGTFHDPKQLVLILNKYMGKAYQLLSEKRWNDIHDAYHELMMGRDSVRSFLQLADNKKFKAIVKGVSSDGRLHLLYNEEEKFYVMHELKWI